jgi:peptidoglycan L-alanyl-D-glutamate endopeptidase CwlK
MSYVLGNRSKQRLTGLHPDLVAVVELAITKTDVDFTVLEGMRTKSRQRSLFTKGSSMTMNSRHLTGHAVDLGAYVDGEVKWDWPLYHRIAKAMNEAAMELKVDLDWGGDWKSFPDGPHFQLRWSTYPT